MHFGVYVCVCAMHSETKCCFRCGTDMPSSHIADRYVMMMLLARRLMFHCCFQLTPLSEIINRGVCVCQVGREAGP